MKLLDPKIPCETFEANCLFGFLNINTGFNLKKYDFLLTNINDIEEARNNNNIYIASLTMGYDEVFIDHYLGSPNCLTRNIINEVLNYCFTLKDKVVALVSMENNRQRRMCERLGFRLEGTIRQYGKRYIAYYGLFVNEWEKSKYKHRG